MKIRILKFLFVLLCIVEVLIATSLSDMMGPVATPVLFLATSLSIAFLYFRLSKNVTTDNAPLSNRQVVVIKCLSVAVFAVVSFLAFSFLNKLFLSIAINADDTGWSDVIPQIMHMTRRFMHHESVYVPIHFNGYDLFPTYLPLQWLPYTLAEYFKFDYRWTGVFFFWISCVYFFISGLRSKQIRLTSILILTWPLLVWYVMMLDEPPSFGVAVESLVGAYYLFVVTTIKDKNIMLMAVGISCCLLSRYSIVFWVPLCLYLLYLNGEKKKTFMTAGVMAAFFIVFYWGHFLRKDITIFSSGYAYHTLAAGYIWEHHQHISYLGFAEWVNTDRGNELWQFHMFQHIHLALCICAIIIPAVVYIRNRAKYSLKPFLLFSLKIYLTVFYLFIQIPFKYLYIVPVIITSALLSDVFNRKTVY